MNKSKIIGLSVALVAAIGVAAVVGIQALTPPQEPVPETSAEHLEATVEADVPADTDDSHALPELTQEDIDRQIADGTLIDPGEVPAKVQAKAVDLAKLWVTFDSRETPEVREKQLSQVIPNPGDWVELPAELISPENVGWGDPTSYAVSTSTTEPAPYEPWTFSIDGTNNVAVQTPVSAEYFSGNGAKRARFNDTLIYQFKFDAQGNLIEVTPPE